MDLQSRVGLLEDTFHSDSGSDVKSEYQDEGEDQLEFDIERVGKDNMSSKMGNDVKVAGVETNVNALEGDRHTKSSDGAQGSGSFGMASDRAAGNQVDGEVLEHAIENLETKNQKWWAYLLTRDFWIILVLG